MKTFTLGQLIDSMEKNGYTQTFDALMRKEGGSSVIRDKSEVASACALGQGMLNLDVRSITFNHPTGAIFIRRVANLNDRDRLPPDKIAQMVREEFKDDLEITFTSYTWDEKGMTSGFTMR